MLGGREEKGGEREGKVQEKKHQVASAAPPRVGMMSAMLWTDLDVVVVLGQTDPRELKED